MVDIISPPKKLTCECSNCGAGLSFVKTEVQTHKWMDYGGDNNIKHFIVCPACQTNVIVSREWNY